MVRPWVRACPDQAPGATARGASPRGREKGARGARRVVRPGGPVVSRQTRGHRLSMPGPGGRGPGGQPEGPKGEGLREPPAQPQGSRNFWVYCGPGDPLPFKSAPGESSDRKAIGGSRSQSLSGHVWDMAGQDRKAIVAQGAGARGAWCSRSGLDRQDRKAIVAQGAGAQGAVLEERCSRSGLDSQDRKAIVAQGAGAQGADRDRAEQAMGRAWVKSV